MPAFASGYRVEGWKALAGNVGGAQAFAPETPEVSAEPAPPVARWPELSISASASSDTLSDAQSPNALHASRLAARLRDFQPTSRGAVASGFAANAPVVCATHKPPQTAPTQPISGTKQTRLDGFHVRRGAYLLRYVDGSGLQRGISASGPHADSAGLSYMGGDQVGSSASGFFLDGVLSFVLAPLAALFSFRAGKQAVQGFKAAAKLKQQEAALIAREQAAAQALEAGPSSVPAHHAAQVLAMGQQRRNTKKARELVKNNARESACSAVDRGALCANLATSMVAKGMTLGSGKNLGLLAADAGSAGVGIAGAVCALGLGPIAGIFQLAEAAFLLRRSGKMKKDFDAAAHDALRYAKSAAHTEGLADYAAFVERKHGIRDKFHRWFRGWTRFRMATAALLGAAASVKFGIAIAALAGGAFALSNPVGWALTGVVIVIAVVAMLGACTFMFDRRRASYERYTRQDDPLVDREFIQHLDALEALQTPAEQPLAQAARALKTPPPASHRNRHARGDHPGDEAEYARPLLDHIDSASSADLPDGSDSDDDTSPPAVAAAPVARHGIGYRAALFDAFKHQSACHQTLHRGLRARFGKTAMPRVARYATTLRAMLGVLGRGSWALLRHGRLAPARASWRQHWMAAAPRLTLGHYQQTIGQGAPAWRAFMTQHLTAEKIMLEKKQRIRSAVADAALPADHPLMRQHERDDARQQKIIACLDELQRPADDQIFDVEMAPQPSANRAFLALMHNKDELDALQDEQVTDLLAKSMHKHFKRRNRDLKGILFATELDAARVRNAATGQSHETN